MEAPKVYEAISAVMAVMAKEGIAKDRKNQQQGYNFRGIDDVYNALGKVLAENKLMLLPRVISKEREERTTAKGGLLMYTILTVEFDLVCSLDGSKHTVCMIGEAMDSADKSANKAQSAALKYATMQVFMIPTEGDNDADGSTHEVAPKQKTSKSDPDTRKLYAELVADMRKCAQADDLGRWWKDKECVDLRHKLPGDWQDNLRKEWVELGTELRKKQDTVKDIQDDFPGSTVVNERLVSTLEAGE